MTFPLPGYFALRKMQAVSRIPVVFLTTKNPHKVEPAVMCTPLSAQYSQGMQLSPHSSHLVSHLLLVNTSARLHVVAEGNHLSTASWRSWRCESITEANQEDSPGDLDQAQSTSPLECSW